MMETVQAFAAKQALKYIESEPEKNLPKLLDWADHFDKDNLYASQRRYSITYWSTQRATGIS